MVMSVDVAKASHR